MQTVINKIFPEWSNFSEANKNFLHTEDQFVKSLELIKSFEGNNQNVYQIRTLSFLNQKVHEISSTIDDGNQAISCVNLDLKNLESVFNNFQTKKIDKIRFDNSYKRSIKRADEIHDMIEKNETILSSLQENEDHPEPGSKQEKFDQEFNEYQKTFALGIGNIVSELSATKLRTATSIAEIGENFADKKSPIEIYHRDTIEELDQEMKLLKKVIRENNRNLDNEGEVDICDDDGFTIIQDPKKVNMSDCEEEEIK